MKTAVTTGWDVKPKAIKEDLKAAAVNRGLFQMTHMTAQRGALKHDDRIDVLAQAVEYWKAHLSADLEKAEAQHTKKLDREFEKQFFAGSRVGHLLKTIGRQRGSGRRR